MAKGFIHFVIRSAQICSSQGHLCSLMGMHGSPFSPCPTAVELDDTSWCQWILDYVPGSYVNVFTNVSLQETHNSGCHIP